ncbi:MAG: bacillithiol biosynthesis cysteine-adding enzyme BshC [Sediminibacterium sp.]
MDHSCTHLSYQHTNYFSRIVSDYLQQSPSLRPFYKHAPDLEGVKSAIKARKTFNTPRSLLVSVLKEQYAGLPLTDQAAANINALLDENTFTVTTAHQPNIFTGPLYFIYKILHTVKNAATLSEQLPGHRFVPVYYMGSEDADLDELGFVNINGQRLVWETKQQGAVGRMKVDKALIKLMHAMEGQLGVLPHGNEFMTLLKQCYTEGKSIQQATLELVNLLFGQYGLLVLIPDNAKLKSAFDAVVRKELLEGFSHKMVETTIESLGKTYKVQAGGREINLFYLIDDKRERIEHKDGQYEVRALGLNFTQEAILEELTTHPERFSANVILRGTLQETVLPNIAFIGGGGELAYWLELKGVFEAVQIPYPVLVLRNSFLLLKQEQEARIKQLGFDHAALFASEHDLLNELVKRNSTLQLSLTKELEETENYYVHLKQVAGAIDITLQEHVTALQVKAIKKLRELEKKMLRAEKTKFEAQQRQISKLKAALFPGNSLQERMDNISAWYAQYGKEWLALIYAASGGLEQEFTVVTI